MKKLEILLQYQSRQNLNPKDMKTYRLLIFLHYSMFMKLNSFAYIKLSSLKIIRYFKYFHQTLSKFKLKY